MASVGPNTLCEFSVPQLELTADGTGRGMGVRQVQEGNGSETGPGGEWE